MFSSNNFKKILKAHQYVDNQDGFVLVLSMLIMIVLIVIGITSMNGSKTELSIAGNAKMATTKFYQAESGSYTESVKVGSSSSPYLVSDPGTPNQILSTTSGSFVITNPTTWPSGSYATGQNYNSLVTYLHASTPPKGYDASQFSGYKFRINGTSTGTNTKVVELGGNKVGVKISI